MTRAIQDSTFTAGDVRLSEMAPMDSLREILRRSLENENGQGLTEYALVLLLVSIVLIAGLMALGADIDGLLQTVIDAFP